jgi:hypothetical protein
VGCSVFGNVNQTLTQKKQAFFNCSYKQNTEVPIKSKAKGMFVKTLQRCVRPSQNFADSTAAMLGCSEGLETWKVFGKEVKLKVQNNRCQEFPATCNRSKVSGLCILLSIMLMCPIFVHISLFIFSLNLT